MSLTSTAIGSIELVQPEIESTIQQAELSLSRFQENRDSGEDLQNCIDCLNQLRGIFVVIEIQGCVLLCQEAVALGNEVPVGANDDKNGLLANLSNAIFILRRYTEYFSHKKADNPELLLPIINELRKVRKAKPFPESHFFEFNAAVNFDTAQILQLDASKKLSDFDHHARRFRHMYQVGLLDLLRDGDLRTSYRLIERAAEGSAKLCAGDPLSNFWALVAVTTSTMREQGMKVSDLRKRLFMKVEKYLREMVLVGKVVSSKSAPDSLKKDLVYLLALSGSESPAVGRILDGFEVNPLDVDDAQLNQESKRLFGPGVDVLRSLSKAIQEEMIQLKDKLDILERGAEPNAEDLEFIGSGLRRLSGTLSMLDLTAIAALCNDQAVMVETWAESNKLISESELISVADAILLIESSIKRYEETGQQPELEAEGDQGSRFENNYLSEARVVVIDESESGLALAKRSITSYLDSGGDKLHLANIGQVMDGIRGGMLMIEEPRIAEIVMTCLDCINNELFENEALPEPRILETLADALASLEYYVESMKFKDSSNPELLKLSEESLASIGYTV